MSGCHNPEGNNNDSVTIRSGGSCSACSRYHSEDYNCQLAINNRLDKKIDLFEERHNALFADYNHLEDAIVELRAHAKETSDHDERINDLENICAEKRLHKIESHFSGDYQLIASRKMPHKCPLCNGFGSPHIESTMCADGPRKHHLALNPCHGCSATGIVWG